MPALLRLAVSTALVFAPPLWSASQFFSATSDYNVCGDILAFPPRPSDMPQRAPLTSTVDQCDAPPHDASAEALGDSASGAVTASAKTSGHGAAAHALATWKGSVVLEPLPGFNTTTVNFSVSTNYTIQLNLGPGQGDAQVTVAIPEFNFFDNHLRYQYTGGSTTGLLNSGNYGFDHCPCVFTLILTVEVNAKDGASALASDPFTVNLPPGWTYRIDSGTSTPTGARFVPVSPCRIADTRLPNGDFGGPVIDAGASRSFPIPQSPCGIPSTAQAFSLNVTVVPQRPLGYLTLWPAGQTRPLVSTLNSPSGRTLANAAIVPAGTGGAVSVFVSDPAHVILDINGYFAPPDDPRGLAFFPVTPCRISDTRNAVGPFGGPSIAARGILTVPVPVSTCGIPANAQAYSINATVVPKGPLAYLTLWPAGQTQPFVSTLNSGDGATLANAAIVPAGANGAISVFATDPTDLVLDINGYFAPPATGGLGFYPLTACRISDTRNPAGTFGGPAIAGGSARAFAIPASSCGVPVSAQAYSLNATVVPAVTLQYLTLWPTGSSQPFVSTLNSAQGLVVANAAIVPAGTAGAVSAFVTNQADLILDINGYFAP